MNNKGFTLVELLATLVIMGLVLGIASTSVLSSINTSKKRSEKIFVEKTERLIDDYLSQYGSNLSSIGSSISFTKTYYGYTNNNNSSNQTTVTATEVSSFKLNELISKKLIDSDKFVNPANKQKCLTNKEPTVRVWKDSDFVYYYYIDLSGTNTSCNISIENGIISTIPISLCNKMTTDFKTENGKCIKK